MKRLVFAFLSFFVISLIILIYNYKSQSKQESYTDPDPHDVFTPCQMGCLQVLQKNGVCTDQHIRDINDGLNPASRSDTDTSHPGRDCLFSYIGCNAQNCCTPYCKAPCPGQDPDNQKQDQSISVLQNLIYLLDEFPYIAFA